MSKCRCRSHSGAQVGIPEKPSGKDKVEQESQRNEYDKSPPEGPTWNVQLLTRQQPPSNNQNGNNEQQGELLLYEVCKSDRSDYFIQIHLGTTVVSHACFLVCT